ncbi:hypothetical protein OU995_00775 [Roseateles sp. SL47]|uniref:hypothetical protein n=1 Tax=Roseateles sp. SL47 TaxID=2995138 RepID=UPI00226E2723|nr:hypothetical protein [Roseateles sp. SL47]WAC73318.1 hypothetical protein OU995_00775 [Roseateles sp. SL47]
MVYTRHVMRSLPALTSRRLSWSRWLVLALMGLCLPLQGVLAVTMQMSMAAETAGLRAPTAAVAGLHAHPSPLPHTSHPPHPDRHPGAHSGHAAHGGHAADATDPDQAVQAFHTAHASHACGDPSAQHHGCSFCAQCCIGVALLATPFTVAATLPAGTPPTTALAALLERQPQTPDRPPKHLLA